MVMNDTLMMHVPIERNIKMGKKGEELINEISFEEEKIHNGNRELKRGNKSE